MSRSIKLVLATAVLAVVLIPAGALAMHQFTDVPDSNIFHADIDWLADNGITLGCNPPSNDRYCPGANVTREQMAAFMRRLAVNQVVDADQLDGKDSSDFVQKGEANSVSSSMMIDLVGIAQATDGNPTQLTGTAATIVSVDLDAPAAGFVLVQASFEAFLQHTETTAEVCLIDVSNVADTLPTDIAPNTILASAAPSGNYSTQAAASRVFQVAGAGTHTFYLVGEELLGDCRVDDIAVTALYVPVAHGALAGSPAGTSTDSSDGY